MTQSDPMLEALRAGDTDAIAALVEANHRALRSYVASLCVGLDAVDDVAQEVFLRVLERLDKVASVDEFPAFLRGFARNVALEWHRRKGARHAHQIEWLADTLSEQEPPASLASDEVLGALRHCLSLLAPRARQMLELRYTEDIEPTVIAQRFSMTPVAVRVALLRVRDALRTCLRNSSAGSALP